MSDKTRAAAIDEYRRTWAIRPETLTAMAAYIRGEAPAAAVAGEEHAGPEAALRAGSSPVTGGIAVLGLRGIITPAPSFFSLLFGGGGGGLQSFRASFRDALANDEVSAILLDVDSPGGRTDLVAETAAEIRAARGTKPIVAIANTWAASAAYWIASQADELVVTPSGEVGSIGVFKEHQDWSSFNEQLGVDVTYISAGKYKTEGNPDEPLSDEARAAIQTEVDEFYGLFVADVAKGRGATANAVRNGFGEGRMVTARQAVAAGLADKVDTFEGTVARLVRGGGRRGRSAEADPAERHAEEQAPAPLTNDERRALADVLLS